ncbi:MAG TPA: Wzz/FepE/Etk N-terminal domain-containing protein, partial [Actinomycetota bacterium]
MHGDRGESGAMESEALLRELVRVPWRHRVLVVIVTALVTGASLVWAYKQPVEYSASSRILLTSLSVKARKALGVSTASAGTLDSLSPATQAKLIGSPQIAEVVSKAINGLISKEQLADSVNATVVPGSQNLIQITAIASNPRLAQAEGNAFAEAYLAYRTAQNAAEVAAVTKQIGDQKAAIEARIADAEHRIEQATAALGLLPPLEQSDTAQQAIRASQTADQNRATADRTALLKTRQELNTQQDDLAGATGSPGQIVTRATLPTAPVGPGAFSIGLAGLAGGLMLGMLAAFLRDRLGDRVGGDETVWNTGAPVLARVPRLARITARVGDLLVTAASPQQPSGGRGPAEIYRGLREALAARGLGETHRILLVTSPGRREGKSVTAANLAAALAGSGLSTIVVSADLRRPRLGAFFGIDERPGLTDVLKGNVPLSRALRSSGIPNLMVLPTAPDAATGSDLLATPGFARLLRSLADEAEVVVVDAAGVADGADAAILAGLCGASLLVVQDGVTLAGAAERAVQALSRAGATSLGTVVSPAPPTSALVRVTVAGLGAATVLLGSVVWASTASQRGSEGDAIAVNTPSAIAATSPSGNPVPGAVVDPVSRPADEMTPEIRALWEAALATPTPSPDAPKASPSPDKKPSPASKPTVSPAGGSTSLPSTIVTAPSPTQPPAPPGTSPTPVVSPSPVPSHVNHIPSAHSDHVDMDEDVVTTITPLTNDTGLEDGVAGIVITKPPTHGTA